MYWHFYDLHTFYTCYIGMFLFFSLRAIYGTDETRNGFHGSDSLYSADREIRFFFSDSKHMVQIHICLNGCFKITVSVCQFLFLSVNSNLFIHILIVKSYFKQMYFILLRKVDTVPEDLIVIGS